MSMYNTSVPVLYEQLVAGGVQEVCGVVEVETHTSCRCGCEEVECTSLQMYDKRMCQCRCRDQGAMGQCLVQYNKVSMYMVVVVVLFTVVVKWLKCASVLFIFGYSPFLNA